MRRQTIAIMTKKPAHVMALATDRKVEAMTVAVTRLAKVATDMALARTMVEKTSEGMSQAPGPIPTLKKARYSARPTTASALLSLPPTKAPDTSARLRAMPSRDTKKSGLL